MIRLPRRKLVPGHFYIILAVEGAAFTAETIPTSGLPPERRMTSIIFSYFCSNMHTVVPGPPGIPVLKVENSPPLATKFPKIPVIEKDQNNVFRGTVNTSF